MKVLIVGCGRVGSRLAIRLSSQGHDVTVVDESREAFVNLGPNYTAPILQGSGMDMHILERANARGSDVVIALTGGDNRNLMIAQLAQKSFGVERVVARLHDPVRTAKFRELGIEVLCTTTVIEGLLELYVRNGTFPDLPGEMSPFGDAGDLDLM